MFTFILRVFSFKVLLMAVVVPAYAIVHVNTPSGNISAPTGTGFEPPDPGFSYVGQINGSSGVYLGSGWVLTANHVGEGNFTLGGTTYNYNGVDSYQIGGADLRLFKLSSAPALPGLSISTITPSLGQGVIMIGAGRSPTSDASTLWYVDQDDPENWIWDTSPFSGWDYNYIGYQTNSSTAVRWGTNVVEGFAANGNIVTDFDFIDPLLGYNIYGPTTFESQAVKHDSGGALFVENNENWELAGTIVAVGTFNNQPGGTETAVAGNITHAIDLSLHADEIIALMADPITVPEVSSFALLMGLTSLLCLNGRRDATRSKTHGSRRCL